MALSGNGSRHGVKLQIFCREFRSKSSPTRVIIRVESRDVAEIRLDEQIGTCRMSLLASPLERTLECYESLELILSMLGHDGAHVLGSFAKFASDPSSKLLLQGLPPRSTTCLCQSGRLLGWPCVMNHTEGRMVLYFSNNKMSGAVMDKRYLRRLDDPWNTLHSKETNYTAGAENGVCSSVSVFSAAVPEIDEYGLPTNIGHGFESTML